MTPLEPPAGVGILVGDSRRAFVLAQALMVQPRMSHQARGLWGYTGTSETGHDLTVQSTGIGGPSAVAVIGDLVAGGVRTAVRLGTCVALDHRLRPGTALLVERALAEDGAGRALARYAQAGSPQAGSSQAGSSQAGSSQAGRSHAGGPGEPDPAPAEVPGQVMVKPDPELFESLRALAEPATVSSHDLVARQDPRPAAADGGDGPPPAARDLQTAATLAIAARLDLRVAALLVVAESGPSDRLTEAELETRFLELGPAVLSALENRKA